MSRGRGQSRGGVEGGPFAGFGDLSYAHCEGVRGCRVWAGRVGVGTEGPAPHSVESLEEGGNGEKWCRRRQQNHINKTQERAGARSLDRAGGTACRRGDGTWRGAHRRGRSARRGRWAGAGKRPSCCSRSGQRVLALPVGDLAPRLENLPASDGWVPAKSSFGPASSTTPTWTHTRRSACPSGAGTLRAPWREGRRGLRDPPPPHRLFSASGLPAGSEPFPGDFLFWSKFYVHSKTDRKAQRIPTYPCPGQAQLPPVIASAGTLVAIDEPALRSHHHLEP
ncbi:uncharacterized protein LOC122430588 [Cervus canadensis]|uniref:uncharacterized protein LOC122430588 n=1 Tax=Cervus canadensis TaxID=1574408 RepID=UPI001CA3464B|nr:uncharacterized protein LOC122430588 [Cervus canadensis]XP_043307216.1 uncharacterized protein LOC122430588 [Cervus canadensis]